MPASNRRRGSAAILVLGFAGGLPFCSGGNFSTGSAIALFLPWRFPLPILNGVAHVFLDGLELRQQAVGVRGIDALDGSRGQFRATPRYFAEQRPRRLAQIKPVDAAVGLVAALFDPAIVTEAIDQS